MCLNFIEIFDMFSKYSLHQCFNFLLIFKLIKSFLQPTDSAIHFQPTFQTVPLATILLSLRIQTSNSVRQVCLFNFNLI